MVTSDQIAVTIRQVRDRFIASGEAPSYWAINNGLCEDFAMEVATALGGETDELYGVGNGSFSADGDDFSGDWDWKLLLIPWGIKPTSGLTEKQASAIDFGSHVWLTNGKRHYDAECPEGVASFFDLPIFRRHIVQELRERGIACDDVAADDVVAPPQCLVPNPVHIEPFPRMRA